MESRRDDCNQHRQQETLAPNEALDCRIVGEPNKATGVDFAINVLRCTERGEILSTHEQITLTPHYSFRQPSILKHHQFIFYI